MSFSLSRQIYFGFQVDLFYFFLVCLIEQLRKINLALAFVGMGFGYALFILRYSLNIAPSYQYLRDQDVHSVVIDVNLQTLAQTDIDATTHDLSDGASAGQDIDIDAQCTDFASMMQPLMTCMEAIQQGNWNLTHRLHELAKKCLEDNSELAETDHYLYECAAVGDHISIVVPSSGTINDLHEIAKRMFAYGFGKEWSDVYISRRREFLEETVLRLGLLKHSIEDIDKMSWQDLEDEIERWIRASNVAFKIVFPCERQLCDRIYFGHSYDADILFMEVCKVSAMRLLNFPKSIAIGSRSPNRLLRIIAMFETLRDLIPEFEALFSDPISVSIRNEAITIWKRMGDVIRGMFMELENLIRLDPSKMVVPGGGIHPINHNVMRDLHAVSHSRKTLEQVFEDYGHPLKEYPKLEDRLPSSSLSVQMNWIMELLESNLEAKSKMYKDPALCYVFLMNNSMYIVQETNNSELGTLLGDDWIQKYAAKVMQFRMHYQRSSWNKVLGILKLDSNGSMPPIGLAKSMKEKLKSFNALFEEICREQSSWFVFDDQVREEIIISLEEILLPAYRNFVWRFQSVPELGKHADKYIKYGLLDIQARLHDLFQGSSG